MKTQYVICDQFGTIRIEPAVYGDFDYVQTYADAEAAGRAAEMLNEEYNGYLVKDGDLAAARPWTVWEMKPHDSLVQCDPPASQEGPRRTLPPRETGTSGE